MTVDGPEIGTLVVIVDRAKNLPNRKTIGKQDPYCAARLGKEAKKTETDRRGGQTPRWDQELRFTVHDSPDYYQLKVSVFNDDKKTDLIGETWVNLNEVVVPGGGQGDVWHNLSCKGKYAGEIRIEITYYDTRPKAEKPQTTKQSATNGVDDTGKESLKGPRQPKAPVKRRPLPSDPVTGAPAPSAIPDHVQTPPRSHQSPTGTPNHEQNSRGYPPAPANSGPEYSQTPPRGYQPPSVADYDQYEQTPPRSYPTADTTEYAQPSPRAYPPQNSVSDYRQTPPKSYQPPAAIPDHVQTPTRGYQTQNFVPDQSPLQRVEYNTPPAQFSPRGYDNSPNPNSYAPASPNIPQNSYDRYDPYDSPRNDYQPRNNSRGRYDDEDDIDPRDTYNSLQSPYELPQPEDFGPPPSPGPPPPPPVHGNRHGSSHASPAALQQHGSYSFPSDTRTGNSYEPPQNDFQRRSVPSYAQPKSYQAYSPPKTENHRKSSYNEYQESPPRHNSYDARYNNHYDDMQPTVEDAPPSPSSGPYSRPRDSASRSSRQDEQARYEADSPAPLNLSGRGSAISMNSRNNNSPTPNHQYSNSIGYTSSNSQISVRDRSQTTTSTSSGTSYNTMSQQYQQNDRNLRGPPPRQLSIGPGPASDDYGMAPVPATLVAGMDPMIAQEISERIYDEKRAMVHQSAGSSSRGRYQEPPQYQQGRPHSNSYQETTMVPYIPAVASTSAASYDERQSRYSAANVPTAAPSVASYDERPSRYSASNSPAVNPRGVSPDPRRALTRKSVSPAPPPPETRRLSGVPFGPDSYNALNPKISGSTSTPSLSARYDTQEPDPDAKIITHDGREIDPSDHIPESNYAPLLESKGPKYASQLPDRNYRPPPSNPQPGSSGRRPLKQAGRPQSMALPASSGPVFHSGEPNTPPMGRNRLQKKANRMSAMPNPQSSPLAPITPYQNNSGTPRSMPRPSTGDYHSSENYAPSYGSGYRGGSGPPIPAKVPMNSQPHPQSGGGGGDAWALMEEMKNIDLGSGRARRRNNY